MDSTYPDFKYYKKDIINLIIAFVLFSSTHAFCYMNLTYSGESLTLNAFKSASAQFSTGKVLQYLYWKIRGPIASPFLIGVISFIALYGSLLLISHLINNLRSHTSFFFLSGFLLTSSALLSLNASSLYTADATCISFFLISSGVYVLIKRKKWQISGIPFILAGLAMDSSNAALALGLLFLYHLDYSLTPQCSQRSKKSFVPYVLIILSITLYIVGYLFLTKRFQFSESISISHWGNNVLELFFYPVMFLFKPLSAYPHILFFFYIITIFFCVIYLVFKKAFISLFLLILICLCPSIPVLSQQEMPQCILPFCLLNWGFLIVFSHSSLSRHILCRRVVSVLVGVLFVGFIIFANQVYLKINLEYQSTLSVITRVIKQIESVPGYIPGYSRVAIQGTPNNSSISISREGFEHLTVLDAANTNYSLYSESQNTWYFWEILGYPLNIASDFELDQLKDSGAFNALPSFPDPNCCQKYNDWILIKLSD